MTVFPFNFVQLLNYFNILISKILRIFYLFVVFNVAETMTTLETMTGSLQHHHLVTIAKWSPLTLLCPAVEWRIFTKLWLLLMKCFNIFSIKYSSAFVFKTTPVSVKTRCHRNGLNRQWKNARKIFEKDGERTMICLDVLSLS